MALFFLRIPTASTSETLSWNRFSKNWSAAKPSSMCIPILHRTRLPIRWDSLTISPARSAPGTDSHAEPARQTNRIHGFVVLRQGALPYPFLPLRSADRLYRFPVRQTAVPRPYGWSLQAASDRLLEEPQ